MSSNVVLPTDMSFPKTEESIHAMWEAGDMFQTSLKLSEGKPEYTFYDGPPFATGMPHYGHILAGTIKDTVTRFAHQTGHHVSRRAGWDCHGLPIEYEIDKKLGITGREDVLKMGIKAYNAECRGTVDRFAGEWERIVGRLGRWIDFKNDYKTMDPDFMESVWWVFSELFKKGLVYEGYKVMPYSTTCSTPLSNFEAGLNYKDVSDPSVVVSFPILGAEHEGASLLAWTTTPWTLPSNLALCVNPEFVYVKIADKKTGATYVLGELRLSQLYPQMNKKNFKPEMKADLFEEIGRYTGADLKGLRYTPLFDYFADREGVHQVCSDGYVTADAGTGVVHQAPAFGEDDYRVCLAHGVIAKGSDVPCPVDANGRFTARVTEFAGKHVKDADKDICAYLKGTGRLVLKDSIVHSYPFCWRSDTPLIYRAVPSYFVAVEKIKPQLIANNKKTKWVPAAVGEKRFHNWLEDARDWAISRNRFWGTPIPLWVSADGEEKVAIGSIAQLEELSGVKVTDLHRESIDDIEIPSKEGRGPLRRIDEVFDCWFESGSMPYAQQHYPFENKEKFHDGFPADFIAEGLDQTRGWFYTLMVLSTALYDKPAFKNLICNGLVLAEDGKKMSKRLKNYPDPMVVINKYGADALRLYLINSPVVRADSLAFKEAGVRGVLKDVMLPWYNAFRFFIQNAQRWDLDAPEGSAKFAPDAAKAAASTNLLDVWIHASVQGLTQFVHEEMKNYRLYTVVPRLVKFVEQLTNWYVRLNRNRLKGEKGREETLVALSVLYGVLLHLATLMAPFTPYFAEFLYQNLRKMHPDYLSKDVAIDAVGRSESVHYLMVPDYDPSMLDPEVEANMALLQAAIELGRAARDKRKISLKSPVMKVTVVSADGKALAGLEALAPYLLDELNAKALETSTDEEAWCTMTALPNTKLLGKRLGKALGPVAKAVKALTHEQMMEFLEKGAIEVCGQPLETGDLLVRRGLSERVDAKQYEAAVSADSKLMVVVDTTVDESIVFAFMAREVVNRVQKLRKGAKLEMTDLVNVYVADEAGPKGTAARAVAAHADAMKKSLRTAPLPLASLPKCAVVIARETAKINDSVVEIVVAQPCVSVDRAAVTAATAAAGGKEAATAEAVASLVEGLDRATLGELVSCCVDGVEVELKHGEHYHWGRL